LWNREAKARAIRGGTHRRRRRIRSALTLAAAAAVGVAAAVAEKGYVDGFDEGQEEA